LLYQSEVFLFKFLLIFVDSFLNLLCHQEFVLSTTTLHRLFAEEYYDEDILDSNYKNSSYKSSHSNDPNSINNKNQNIDKIHSNTIKSLNDQFSNDDIKDSHITDTISNQNRFENHKEKFEKAILAQLKCNTDTSISRTFGIY
jgi:hypothetical protein